jgi:hypothetical protein
MTKKKREEVLADLTMGQVREVVRHGQNLDLAVSEDAVRAWIRRGALAPVPSIGRGQRFSREDVRELLGGWNWRMGRLEVAAVGGSPSGMAAKKQAAMEQMIELMVAEPTISARQIGIRLGIWWGTLCRYIEELESSRGLRRDKESGWVLGEAVDVAEVRRIEYLGELRRQRQAEYLLLTEDQQA